MSYDMNVLDLFEMPSEMPARPVAKPPEAAAARQTAGVRQAVPTAAQATAVRQTAAPTAAQTAASAQAAAASQTAAPTAIQAAASAAHAQPMQPAESAINARSAPMPASHQTAQAPAAPVNAQSGSDTHAEQKPSNPASGQPNGGNAHAVQEASSAANVQTPAIPAATDTHPIQPPPADTHPMDPSPADAKEQPSAPEKELTLDMSSGTVPATDGDAGRREHEVAEAKRRAEWEARQAEKQAAKKEQMERIAAMSDEEIASDAIKRIGADTEKLTRRNMKEMVSLHIQELCRKDAAFARRAMSPDKGMINCFQYINRKAREYAEQEMKDNGIQRNGVYGCDVPDGLCYQWAEDYFNDPDAKEDQKDEEKFVPRPYTGSGGKAAAKAGKKKAEPKAGKGTSGSGGAYQQMTLEGVG